MSDLTARIGRDHRVTPNGWSCLCGRESDYVTINSRLRDHAQHIAEVTEAAVREQIARDIEAHIGTEPILKHVPDWTDGMETAQDIAWGDA